MNLRERFALHAGLRPAGDGGSEAARATEDLSEGAGAPAASSAARLSEETGARAGGPAQEAGPAAHVATVVDAPARSVVAAYPTPQLAGGGAETAGPVRTSPQPHAPSGRGALAPDISRVRGEAYAHGVYRLFVHGRSPRRAPPRPPTSEPVASGGVYSPASISAPPTQAASRDAPAIAPVAEHATRPSGAARAPAGAPQRAASSLAPLPPSTTQPTVAPPATRQAAAARAPFVAPPREPTPAATPPASSRIESTSAATPPAPSRIEPPPAATPPAASRVAPSSVVRSPAALPPLGPAPDGFVRRVVDWPLAPGARPALLGGALARLPLPDAERFRALVPRLLAGVTPGAGGSPVVFLDVETTALDRGAGALAFMVGIAALVDGALRVEQWILTRLSAEAAMLAEVLARVGALAGPGAVLASFNGASFDVPLLRARLRRGGVQPAALERPHLDLLPPSRRMWRGRGPDCRLVTLERTQLGVRRVHDIAGHEIPAVFWAWLRRPDDPETRAVMGRVADHNLADLVTLPALAASIDGCVRAPADLDMAIRAAEHCLIGGRRGDALAVLEAWQPAIRRGGGSQALRRRALMLTADLLRREPASRARAAELWAEVCRISPGDPDAHEALAKHLEHHAGDLARALEVARASAAPCPRRLARLQRKLTGSRSVLVPLRSGHVCC